MKRHILVLAAAAVLSAAQAFGQGFASKTIRIIAPVQPGGGVDHPFLPDAPTFEELGFKGFDGVQWYAIVGPAARPAEVTKKLDDEVNKSLALPALRERPAGEALEVMPTSPGQFAKFIQADITSWGTRARERNMRLDD